MELYKDTFEALVKYLKSHGFPEISLAIEYPIGNLRVDLAVVDSVTKEPLVLFEVKGKKTTQSKQFGTKQLSNFLKTLGRTLPTYLVFESDNDKGFEIEKILFDEGNAIEDKRFEFEEFLKYEFLKQSRRNSLLAEKKVESQQTFDGLRVFCWVSAIITLVLFILDLIGKISLTTSQMSLLAVTIALGIIPFASKLKILGVEFERFSGDSISNNE